MSEELKPCPFCGTQAEFEPEHDFGDGTKSQAHVHCETCGASIWMRDNDECRIAWNTRTPDAGPHIRDCQFIGGNPVVIKDGVSTLEMRGWKCYATGYHPDAAQQDVTLGSDPVLEKALHTFSEKYCLPGSAADHDSFIHGYRAASVETQRLKRQVGVLREGLEVVAACVEVDSPQTVMKTAYEALAAADKIVKE